MRKDKNKVTASFEMNEAKQKVYKFYPWLAHFSSILTKGEKIHDKKEE